MRTLRFAADGVRLRVPRNWTLVNGQSPLLASVSSGRAMVAIWRYPRTEPLPSSRAALNEARHRLVRAARARYGDLRVIRTKVLKVGRHAAIELSALERVAGQARRVRSVHVYAYGAELVLDEYAPESVFHAVDHSVFSPVKRSLHVSAAAKA
jgi:hypothetical protein